MRLKKNNLIFLAVLSGFLPLGCSSNKPLTEPEIIIPEKPELTPDKPEKNDTKKEETLSQQIIGDWAHHREQDAEQGVQVWVRGQKLPPSRFRGAMTFKPDGVCEVRVLHPSDAHYYAQGTYTLSANNLRLEYTQTHNNTVIKEEFRVYIDGDQMRLSQDEKN